MILEERPNGNGYTSLYVNGHKTNIFLVPPGSYDYQETRNRFMLAKKLIKSGQVIAKTWINFDLCEFIQISLAKVEQTNIQPQFGNQIFCCDTPFEIDKEKVLEELRQREVTTQYTKMIHNNILLTRIGVKFYLYGYEVFFF